MRHTRILCNIFIVMTHRSSLVTIKPSRILCQYYNFETFDYSFAYHNKSAVNHAAGGRVAVVVYLGYR